MTLHGLPIAFRVAERPLLNLTFYPAIREPTEVGKEDGWFEVVIDGRMHQAVLEIKGTARDQFGEDGRRQLRDWVDRGISDGKDYVGVFIGAHAIGKPPEVRTNPFSDSWRRSAERFELIALTTADLYRAFELVSCGHLSTEEFWRSVFSTKGIYRLPMAASHSLSK